jgi:hypothetical protein
MSSLALVLALLTQTAPAAPPPMLVTPEGLRVQASSSRQRRHARQIDVARQLWREVCGEGRNGACAAPDHYVVSVDVDDDDPHYCSGVLRLARTAPEYPAGAGFLPGVQFHCFFDGAERKRELMTIQLPNAEAMYLDWPPMPEIN